jgi:hypothetical protein
MKVYRVKLQRVVWQEVELEVVASTDEQALDVAWAEGRDWKIVRSLRTEGLVELVTEPITA